MIEIGLWRPWYMKLEGQILVLFHIFLCFSLHTHMSVYMRECLCARMCMYICMCIYAPPFIYTHLSVHATSDQSTQMLACTCKRVNDRVCRKWCMSPAVCPGVCSVSVYVFTHVRSECSRCNAPAAADNCPGIAYSP